jgi:hypothetical protein
MSEESAKHKQLEVLLTDLRHAYAEYQQRPGALNPFVHVEEVARRFHAAVKAAVEEGQTVLLHSNAYDEPAMIAALGEIYQYTFTFFSSEPRAQYCPQGCNMALAESVEVLSGHTALYQAHELEGIAWTLDPHLDLAALLSVQLGAADLGSERHGRTAVTAPPAEEPVTEVPAEPVGRAAERRDKAQRKRGGGGRRAGSKGPRPNTGWWYGWRPICDVCGQALGIRRIVRRLLDRKPLTYPFRRNDGAREEMDVQWLCGACIQRAAEHRERIRLASPESGADPLD